MLGLRIDLVGGDNSRVWVAEIWTYLNCNHEDALCMLLWALWNNHNKYNFKQKDLLLEDMVSVTQIVNDFIKANLVD